jgi:hypothetical protein
MNDIAAQERESQLRKMELPPLDVTEKERRRSYEENSGWDTQAMCRERQLLAEMAAHAITKQELAEARRTAEYWKAEHLAGNDRIAWIQAQRDAHYQQVQQLKHELAEYRDKEAHFAQFEDDPTDLRGPGDD